MFYLQILTALKIILENYLIHGQFFLFGLPYFDVLFRIHNLTALPLFLAIQVCIFLTFWIEKMAFGSGLSTFLVVLCHGVNVFCLLFIPTQAASFEIMFGIRLLLSLYACATGLKLISYAHYHYKLRLLYSYGKQENERYSPSHLTISSIRRTLLLLLLILFFSDLFWYILAPTLCYQIVYPRSTGIRLNFIFRKTIEFVI